MIKKIFIDGEEGTTGLQIYERLEKHPNIEVINIDPNKRKNLVEKKEMMKKADLVFLCLPDSASREAVALGKELKEHCPIFIDASTAHRTSAMWSYGLPELSDEYRNNINKSNLIAVPGCYATGSNLIIFPLIKMGLISNSHQFIIQAVSGFSGGGKHLIEYQNNNNSPFFYYGLNLDHKHLPEIKFHCGLENNPIFLPSVANFYQGMIVNLFFTIKDFEKETSFFEIESFLSDYYQNQQFIKVKSNDAIKLSDGFYKPNLIANSNDVQINIFKNTNDGQLIISANFDNLGKGASAAAIQCMNLRFGFDEILGL
jgi:N-acetyl-gamma-glutamyl-phosphate reductase